MGDTALPLRTNHYSHYLPNLHKAWTKGEMSMKEILRHNKKNTGTCRFVSLWLTDLSIRYTHRAKYMSYESADRINNHLSSYMYDTVFILVQLSYIIVEIGYKCYFFQQTACLWHRYVTSYHIRDVQTTETD